ncbi:hypothetical protein V6N12_065605 [Hibiscus sabdariffa]|uniref:Uncharacterized protein n=1 Tax=Hibiscus sabdariffa TaxID=183260 RepID=A0ABR2G977_9ROSI
MASVEFHMMEGVKGGCEDDDSIDLRGGQPAGGFSYMKDCVVDFSGHVPSIEFSDKVHYMVDACMSCTWIERMLGYVWNLLGYYGSSQDSMQQGLSVRGDEYLAGDIYVYGLWIIAISHSKVREDGNIENKGPHDGDHVIPNVGVVQDIGSASMNTLMDGNDMWNSDRINGSHKASLSR